ncbi:MAG: hypothetical protein HOC79_01765 [Euryarchaeota archaeon]|nr:hypothetical protein [Euryarchaeota archaeon]
MPFDYNSPFILQMNEEAIRLENGEQIMTVNGSPMGNAIWNLICTKRDLEMYCVAAYSDGRLMKMKPHRNWRVTDVKKYFGIKGTNQKLYDNFMELFNVVMGER